MNKREAKRMAHRLVSRAADAVLRGGFVMDDWADNLSDEDLSRVTEAIDDIAQHHFERSDLCAQSSQRGGCGE